MIVGRYGCPRGDIRFVASILSIPCEDRYGTLTIAPLKLKDEILRAVVDTVAARARKQPTIVLFEDVHWADPTTLEVIDLLFGRLARIPLLIILTHRPEFQPRWSNYGNLTTIALPKLSKKQSTILVSDVSRGTALSHDLLEHILVKTDGVPLFVEEVTRAVLETGTPGLVALSVPQSGLAVPATLHASLMARLDRLGPIARDVAQKGSVIGREFSYELLEVIANLPKPQLQEALRLLINTGLLFTRGTALESVYSFKHALVQDAAYGTLLRSRRQNLHGLLGVALEEQFPEVAKARPELLAHHFTEAMQAERAVEYLEEGWPTGNSTVRHD